MTVMAALAEPLSTTPADKAVVVTGIDFAAKPSKKRTENPGSELLHQTLETHVKMERVVELRASLHSKTQT